MMNKKADLFNNTLETIVAVLGIALLLFGIGYVGYKFLIINQSQEAKNVQTMLDKIETKTNALKTNQKTTLILQETKGDWYLRGWSKSDPADSKPERCFLKTCICMCPENTLDSCQSRGICRNIKTDKIRIFTILPDTKDILILIPGESIAPGSTVTVQHNSDPFIKFTTTHSTPRLIELKLNMTDENSLWIYRDLS